MCCYIHWEREKRKRERNGGSIYGKVIHLETATDVIIYALTTTGKPPKSWSLSRISWSIWSIASKQKRCCIGTLSQIRRVTWRNRFPNSVFLLMLQIELSWRLRGMQSREWEVWSPGNNNDEILEDFFFFFLNSIIATPLAYRGRYVGCYYSIALLLVVYILGSCHASVAAEAPILSISEVLFTARDV